LADNVWELHMKFCEELAASLKKYNAASSGLSGKIATAKDLLMIKEKEMDMDDGQKSTDEELEENVDIQLKNSGPQSQVDTAFNKVMEVLEGGS
jgi:hypothetical protein